MGFYNLVSFAGIFILLGIAWSCSTDRKRMNWRLVFWGTVLQLLFAFFLFAVPAGCRLFLFVNKTVVSILDSAGAGTKFVFGRLALPPGTVSESGESSLGSFLAFQAFPAIVFFSALMSLLYFLRIMPWVIRGFAALFTKLFRISGAESLCVSANIFVGVESALTIRPHLHRMTQSELHTVLTSGMATIASSVLAFYVFVLQREFPTIAGHLMSASLLSAPAALVMSKLVMPESGTPETLGLHVKPEYERERSWIEALIGGANAGVKLVVGVVALLLAFLGLVALVDLGLGTAGMWINRWTGWTFDWTLKNLLGYAFYPLTLAIGVPPNDAWEVARLIGERAVVTEVAAYRDLAVLLSKNAFIHPRSAFITTYALCGFAHVASLAIFVGGTAALAPTRTHDLARLGFRALLSATLACLMTAAVAGTFFTGESLLMGR